MVQKVMKNPRCGTSKNYSIYGLEVNDRIITDVGDDFVEAEDGDVEVNGYPTTGNAVFSLSAICTVLRLR
jgi:hypothetical protein